jgi:hypothetical protein
VLWAKNNSNATKSLFFNLLILKSGANPINEKRIGHQILTNGNSRYLLTIQASPQFLLSIVSPSAKESTLATFMLHDVSQPDPVSGC